MRLGVLALAFAAAAFAQAAAQTPTADRVRQTFGHAPPAAACASDEFVVELAFGATRLSAPALAQLQADLRHPRSCNVEAVYLAAYDPAARNAVRAALIAEGVPAETIRAIEFAVPVSPWPYEAEHVRVTFVYR